MLRATTRLAPSGCHVALYDGLTALPYFNPDLDTDSPPAPIRAFRSAVGASDALLISSPEYARGVAGAMKNALDWLVGSAEFPGKPVALINASPRSVHADAQMRTTLVTMSARLIEDASITLPLLGRNLDADAIVADDGLSAALRAALLRLCDAIGRVPA